MSRTYRKNQNSNDNTAPTKVITSPDGTKIQITAGRKLQQIRSYARDEDITDAQFRALVCIVDRLNEGKEGTDQSCWGSAYPKYDTLAKDIAKDERAARRIVKELESGQRQTRSNGVTKLVPCKSVLIVQRSKDDEERDEVNEYRLREWGAFAVDASMGGAVTCNGGGGQLSDKGRSPVKEGRSPVRKGAVTASDSSQPPTPPTHPINPPQPAPASERPAGLNDLVDENDEDSQEQNKQVDDYPPVDVVRREQYRKSAEAIWLLFQKAPPNQHDEFIQLFVELAQSGEIKSSDEVRYGLKAHIEGNDLRYQKTPVNFLLKREWKTYRQSNAAKPKQAGRGAAI